MKDLALIRGYVNKYFELDIRDKNRKREYVDARFIYFTLSRQLISGITCDRIGRSVGLNHASVVHGIKTLELLLTYDKTIQNNYLTLKNICLSNIENLANPFEKYLGKEDKLQHSVMEYMKFQYPNVYAIHIPNEGKRSPFERFKFKYLGGRAGVPDIMIFRSNGEKNGLAIELKVGYNKPTENQLESIEKLKKENWECHWLNDYDKVIQVIEDYFSKNSHNADI
ncbi:MAG: hypothetical protein Unbinned1643contig1000_19 [Prokaryotic dsDNA virus sp.]|mgnify:FL=1|nr:MAG: hypothetical protein Unbinned1643contig1000_19 [Prokaryotic dsDNA virus sp.]|tara:strand:- start:9396 stop:10070 length:675 start_codon:yes stop_codon:yes gene_type:complete